MQLPELLCAQFIGRENRFLATVLVGGDRCCVHVPNSGRLAGVLQAGRRVWLARVGQSTRKTAYDLLLADSPQGLVCVDARITNSLFVEAVRGGKLFAGLIDEVQREVTVGNSRLDFRLTGPGGTWWVETKSVTHVEDGTALFPDAPTLRGARHLQALTDRVTLGERAAIVFIIQRPDAMRFEPYTRVDPDFAETLRMAAKAGVEVIAATCAVTHHVISIDRVLGPDGILL